MASRAFSVFLIVFSCFIFSANSSERTLSWATNPGCGLSNCDTFGRTSVFRNYLQYVISENATNGAGMSSYRMYWSTIGAPTFLITEAPAGATNNSNIDWVGYIEDQKVEDAFLHLWNGSYAAITLQSLIEFNDTNDTGRLEDANSTAITKYKMEDLRWYTSDVTYPDDDTLLATFNGTLGLTPADSNITIEMRAHKSHLRNPKPPKMLVQPKSMTFRVILNNTKTHYKNSRFALEIIFASNDGSKTLANYTEDKSISDEFSPGIFTMDKIGGVDTYLQWRPVVYTAPVPGVSDSTRTRTGPLSNVSQLFWPNGTEYSVPYSLLLGLANANLSTSTLIHFNVSFGQTGDGFYKSSAFQEWSCEIGLGQPPAEAVSSKIKLIIAIGFGIPAALILVAVGYVAYVKIKRRRQQNGLLITDAGSSYQTLG